MSVYDVLKTRMTHVSRDLFGLGTLNIIINLVPLDVHLNPVLIHFSFLGKYSISSLRLGMDDGLILTRGVDL